MTKAWARLGEVDRAGMAVHRGRLPVLCNGLCIALQIEIGKCGGIGLGMDVWGGGVRNRRRTKATQKTSDNAMAARRHYITMATLYGGALFEQVTK